MALRWDCLTCGKIFNDSPRNWRPNPFDSTGRKQVLGCTSCKSVGQSQFKAMCQIAWCHNHFGRTVHVKHKMMSVCNYHAEKWEKQGLLT